MKMEQQAVVKACSEMSARGTGTFLEVVRRLAEAGVERYHTDYVRMETTYYAEAGGSQAAAMEYAPVVIGGAFSAAGVQDAVKRSQRGELTHAQFVAVSAAAGCVGYFVQVAGGCVQYFGRRGEMHTEVIPAVR